MPATATPTFRWFIRRTETRYGVRYQAVCRWADGVELRPGQAHRTEAHCRAYIRREFRGGAASPQRVVEIEEGWE
jgi:hypothetical protein